MEIEILPQDFKGWINTVILIVVGLLAIAFLFFWMMAMPGKSHSGKLPDLTVEEKEIARRLESHVRKLAHDIGERNFMAWAGLQAAAEYLEMTLADIGYEVRSQYFEIPEGSVRNLEVEIKGTARPEEIVIVGGHYDSVVGCPGADDNASGTAAVIELARLFFGKTPGRTLRFVFFVNEEPPHFQTPTMGSLMYASELSRQKEEVAAMYSLESIGYFSNEPNSQKYPFPFSLFYPDRGNFIGFVGNIRSRGLVRQSLETFRENCPFPSEGIAALSIIPGIGWSDHWAFWKQGYPALMVTDTVPFRNPNYHQITDTVKTLGFSFMARVTHGLKEVISKVAEEK